MSLWVIPSYGAQPKASEGKIEYEVTMDNLYSAVVKAKVFSKKKELYITEPPGGEIISGGAVIKPNKKGFATFSYRVDFPNENAKRTFSGIDGVKHVSASFAPPFQVFKGSDIFIVPTDGDGTHSFANFAVQMRMKKNHSAIVPWKLKDKAPDKNGGEDATYEVENQKSLLLNFIAVGSMDILKSNGENISILVGFPRGGVKLEEKEKKECLENISSLYKTQELAFGKKPGSQILSVIVCPGTNLDYSPLAAALYDSILLACRSNSIDSKSYGALSCGLVELWNRQSFLAAKERGSRWFQEGLPFFYGWRAAAASGVVSPKIAYTGFSSIYREYLTYENQLLEQEGVSLYEAEKRGLLEYEASKGAALCAATAMRIRELSKGQKDFEWLISNLPQKAEKGGKYGLADISELCEEATKESWASFFEDRVLGTKSISASEFSSSELFDPAKIGSTQANPEKKSSRSWIFLGLAVVGIFLIPFLLSGYVRRGTKIEVNIPKIIPDDEDEEEKDA
ncbi:MAG: hypothetical protein PHO53_04215 [Actinomycetota bacterium]|nr:hypothetical protein [Actinomycetota bacterium]